jgi:hypothetical protein
MQPFKNLVLICQVYPAFPVSSSTAQTTIFLKGAQNYTILPYTQEVFIFYLTK